MSVANQKYLKDQWKALGHSPHKELIYVLWAYRTTPRKGTGETPFRLAYGTEAVIPVEIGVPSIRVNYLEEETNEARTRLCLVLLEERRDEAVVRATTYKKQAARYHNKRINSREFQKGDLVLRNAEIGRGNAGVK
ncbi:uncharacterized protein LOC126666834 [Mercurialis annua]|uniref:uncharacterized protein LOC126666834 n=1 Tax=Mercurialis annua TaxID=3986 RepID=UPI00215E3502|nr:uncharacterized protein LOC126666834 [Mercurialis annua]